jgi:hypothetical protein
MVRFGATMMRVNTGVVPAQNISLGKWFTIVVT